MKITVESWAPEYGSPVETGTLDERDAPVDLEVEIPADTWEPIDPSYDGHKPCATVFVDGVRRVDARVWITRDDDITRMGICVSLAAGAVRCASRARVVEAKTERVLISTAGAPRLDTGAGVYEPLAVADDSLDTLMNGLYEPLGQLERQIAEDQASDALLVLDGPLNRNRHQIPGAVGYVKSHRVSHLPRALNQVVDRLQPGQRTPVFLTQTAIPRFNWYLRLPGGEGHPWAGVVRCETATRLEKADVLALAAQTASVLPDYASQAHKDARAPQNLGPIGGLETELRRRLGDANYVHRQLRLAGSSV